MAERGGIEKGDIVRVIAIPSDLDNRAAIGTPEVFAAALGKKFRVEDISERGLLELVVAESHPSADTYESDTIWIEPNFVEPVDNGTSTI